MIVTNINLVFTDTTTSKYTYYISIVLASSSYLFKSLIKIHTSQHHYTIIKKPLLKLIALILIQYPLSIYLTESTTLFWQIMPIIAILGLIYLRVGNMTILITILYYLEEMALDTYLKKHYSDIVLKHISIIFKFSNISLLLSLIFIFMIYNEGEYTKIYSKLNQKIFSLKIVLDMFLIFNYVYNIYYEMTDEYLRYINDTCHIVLVVLVIHYLIIFLALFAKVNFKLDKLTYDSIFKSLDETKRLSGKDTPYFEIKFLKVINVNIRK